jgi:tRNA G46 methylase TrmB
VSAERNQGPILSSLKTFIDQPSGNILEISSGTGQHVSYFASNFPSFKFQPTEFDRSLLKNIDLFTKSMNLSNVLPAKYLDASTEPDQWLDGEVVKNQYDYVLNINMIHVSEWKCTEGIKM